MSTSRPDGVLSASRIEDVIEGVQRRKRNICQMITLTVMNSFICFFSIRVCSSRCSAALSLEKLYVSAPNYDHSQWKLTHPFLRTNSRWMRSLDCCKIDFRFSRGPKYRVELHASEARIFQFNRGTREAEAQFRCSVIFVRKLMRTPRHQNEEQSLGTCILPEM